MELRRPAASCCCMPPSRSVASRKRSAARRESAALAFCEAARRMSSLAWRKRSSACWAACWRLSAACSADCWRIAGGSGHAWPLRCPACPLACPDLPIVRKLMRSAVLVVLAVPVALLPLLPLLALLSLLAILSKLLLHLPLELLRLALQHFLLPLLLGGLGAVALLLGQILLALGQFVELLQRVVDFLRLLFGGGRRGFAGSRTDFSRYRARDRRGPPDRAPRRRHRRLHRRRALQTQPESAGRWLRRAAGIAEPSARWGWRPSTSPAAIAARPAPWLRRRRSYPSGNR